MGHCHPFSLYSLHPTASGTAFAAFLSLQSWSSSATSPPTSSFFSETSKQCSPAIPVSCLPAMPSYSILWGFYFVFLRYQGVSLHVQAAPARASCWKPFWSGAFLRATCISQPDRNSLPFFPQVVCYSSPHHSTAEYPLNDPVWQSWKQGKHRENEATAHRNNYNQLFMLNPHKALSHC